MTTRDDLNSVAQWVGEIPALAATCAAVALALCETREQLYATPGFFSIPTEHERARTQMLNRCGLARRTVANLRRSTLSPELIRAEAALIKLEQCCTNCPAHNAARMAQDEAFECTIEGEAIAPPRFRLDMEGNIHEQS